MEKKQSDIEKIDSMVFKPCGMKLSNLIKSAEGETYFAHEFKLNHLKIIFRTANSTPKKTGQFVAIWKRNQLGQTAPFAAEDPFDCMMIVAKHNENVGFFIFPKNELKCHGIISENSKSGKRGMRIYPSWDQTYNKQAQKSQQWQSKFFVNLSSDAWIDFEHFKKLIEPVDPKNHQDS